MIKFKFNEYFKENTHANRGMTLENDINETNKYYDLNNIAIIYKKPTPIKVVNYLILHIIWYEEKKEDFYYFSLYIVVRFCLCWFCYLVFWKFAWG